MRYFQIIILLLNLCVARSAFAVTGPETRAFNNAVQLFELKQFKQADEAFAKFSEEHPESTNKVQAILHQAQARFYQGDYANALLLLQKELPQAGAVAHEYQYWMGRSFFQSGNFRSAADAYAELNQKFPDSSHRLEVSYAEALAESKLTNWTRVIELLQTAGGRFDTETKAQPSSEYTVDGYLLLAEAFLKQSRFADGEKLIAQVASRTTTPETKWREKYLLCRIQLAANQLEAALQTSTNLLAAAQASGKPKFSAESILLRGEVLEKLHRLPEAILVYEQNAVEGTPPELRRQSFFKTVELNLALGEITNSTVRLEKFLEQNPADPALDFVNVTLGELRLKQFVALTNLVPALVTNLFEQALARFNFVITNFPQSAQLGKAYLNRGWCFWIQENFGAAEADFLEATKRIPISEDQAVARFKLADCQFQLTNYAAAVTNYQLFVQNFGALERVTNGLFEPALYQTVRASLKVGNSAAATNAMYKLLAWFPKGSLGDRSLLLVGKNFIQSGKPAEARNLFLDFLKGVPDSPMAADSKLAIAQSFVQERNWPAALAEYDGWVTNFTNHPHLAEAEFSRALVYEKAGQETNAFKLFTNFVARFPSNQLTALAQNWVADFYWNRDDFWNAEKSFQELLKFNPAPELAYQSRLMAGRAVYDRSDYVGAAKYFADLIKLVENDTNAPAALKAEAWFAFGDASYQQFISNTNESILRDAITAYSRVTRDLPTKAIASLATGRIGDSYFQLAGLDVAQAEARYDKAAESYSNVISSAQADVSARSRAGVCLGNICQKRAEKKSGVEKERLVERALGHYMFVLNKANLRDGEVPDSKWLYESGIAAAKLCEVMEQWEQALKIYEKLKKLLPPLQVPIQKKMDIANARLALVKK